MLFYSPAGTLGLVSEESVMLKGKLITLRPVQETDLDQLYTYHCDIDNRGDYYPRGVLAQPAFHKRFQETGFWSKDGGMLVIVSSNNEILGHIEFFKTVNYLDEYELGYQVYVLEHRRKGIMTESVNLLVRYLFEAKQVNRLRLVIHPDNHASRQLAEKCGFKHEGTFRGAWYHKGTHQDVEIYAILHKDVIAP
jgi:RimJ/RimL family protein N-acetyltransferase